MEISEDLGEKMERVLNYLWKIDTRIDTLSAYVRSIVDTCRGPLGKPSPTPIEKAVRSSPRFKKAPAKKAPAKKAAAKK